MATRGEVQTLARTWIGVPWRHQGRNRSGIDCGGLVVKVGQELGLLGPHDDPKRYQNLLTATSRFSKLLADFQLLVEKWKQSGVGIKLK